MGTTLPRLAARWPSVVVVPTKTRRRTRRRTRAWWVLLPVLALIAGGLVVVLRHGPARPPDGCTVTDGTTTTSLDLAQAANAATISAVGAGLGLSDHAVTVAVATALQESKLHNLPYGDRDSVGLFQQRPSQGWGSREQLLDPHFAATEFFRHLAKVPGWRTLPVADAAQAVQRSAAGSAYADWEQTARVVAQALTGEVAHGVSCAYRTPASSARGLAAALQRDIGPVGRPVGSKVGWRQAGWLVAQAAQYSIETVSYDGQRWTRASGRWSPHAGTAAVTYTVGR